ncbi:hypothetical protein GGX14DRAFT_405779 [Mycena pura]|uniref:Uncharacterized protein n=1 Tax=Mycena pura TaxID=153505 RepID=A0AAD6UYM3_9AGAR|nr:hypothetical protein GGX14DRAFT_405779 [Mycena pura]
MCFQEAMRKSAVPGLPEDDALLKDAMSHAISVDKNTIKSALRDSIKVKRTSERNIAFVTAKILKSFGVSVEPTLSLYYRFALIRNEIKKDHPDNRFWAEVDKTLSELHEESASVMVFCLEAVLQDDIKDYGDPAKTEFKLAADPLPERAPKWLKIVHELAPKLRRVETALTGTKRLRSRVVDDEETDDDSGSGGGGTLSSGNSGDENNSGGGGSGGDNDSGSSEGESGEREGTNGSGEDNEQS